MSRTLVLAATLAGVTAAFLPNPAAAQKVVEFKDHVIEASIPGGYGVAIADFNHDGKPDVIGWSQAVKDLSWYENPSWTPHVMVQNMPGLVNMAFNDIDKDGIPEVAIESAFSMNPARSEGIVTLLSHNGDPTGLWKAYHIDSITTSHHIAWADMDGTGNKILINAPLIQAEQKAPKYEGKVPVYYYRVPADWGGTWKRELMTDQLNGVTHRVRVVKWNGDPKREQLFIAGFDGVSLVSASGRGPSLKFNLSLLMPGNQTGPKSHEEGNLYSIGTSDIKIAHAGKRRFLVAVEPWHGNEVVVYNEDGKGGWARKVIYDQLTEGHEVCVGDLNGDGRDEIIAGDRARGKVASSHIFYSTDASTTEWHHEELDHMGMSASGCEVADMNGDGRPDIVMIGGATHNIKWYENLGATSTSAKK